MKTEHQTRQDIIELALEASDRNINDPTQVVGECDILVKPANSLGETASRYEGH
jgi:hypothetical protein